MPSSSRSSSATTSGRRTFTERRKWLSRAMNPPCAWPSRQYRASLRRSSPLAHGIHAWRSGDAAGHAGGRRRRDAACKTSLRGPSFLRSPSWCSSSSRVSCTAARRPCGDAMTSCSILTWRSWSADSSSHSLRSRSWSARRWRARPVLGGCPAARLREAVCEEREPSLMRHASSLERLGAMLYRARPPQYDRRP